MIQRRSYMKDFSAGIAFAAVTLLIVTGYRALFARVFPNEQSYHRIIHVTVSLYATVALSAVVLGVAGLLYAWLYIALVAVIGGVLLWVCRSPECRTESRSRNYRFWQLIWWMFASLCLGRIVVDGVLRFPDDWDTLTYHLPLVDYWCAAHELYVPDCMFWSVPGNNELLTLWCVSLFSCDVNYALTNTPAIILLAGGSISVARSAGASRSTSHLAAFAVVCTPVVIKQLTTTENDVAVAGLFVCSLASILNWTRTRRTEHIVLGAIASGLLVGIKYYALGYAAILSVIAIMTLSEGKRLISWLSVVWFASIAVFGGYWYYRNLLHGGSPVYPLGASVEADDITSSYRNLWRSTIAGSGTGETTELTLIAIWKYMGLPGVASFLVIPLTLCLLLKRKNILGEVRFHRTWCRQMVAVATLLSGGVALVTPFAAEDVPFSLNQLRLGYCPVRYSLVFLSLAIVCAAIAFETVKVHAFRNARHCWARTYSGRSAQWIGIVVSIVAVSLLVCDVFGVLYSKFMLSTICGVQIFCVGIALSGLFALRVHLRVFLYVIACVSAGVSGAFATGHWRENYEAYYYNRLGVPLEYLHADRGSGVRIGVMDYRCYPFFGARRENRVVQAPHTYTEEWWRDQIETGNFDFVVLRIQADGGDRNWDSMLKWLLQKECKVRCLWDTPGSYYVFEPIP